MNLKLAEYVTTRILTCMAAAIGCLMGLTAQAQTTPARLPTTVSSSDATAAAKAVLADKTHVKLSFLPVDAREFARIAGPRLTQKGQESHTLNGTLTDQSGVGVPVSVLWQNPGLTTITVQNVSPKKVSFDGSSSTSTSAVTPADQDLIESLTDDYPDAFFFAVSNGAAVRFLGSRFRTDDGATKNYQGPWYTIYQKVAPVPGSNAVIQKLYFFDSSTGLLDRVTYQAASGNGQVQTQYSGWRSISGQMVPGKIVRTNASGVEFTLTISQASFGAANSVGAFQQKK